MPASLFRLPALLCLLLVFHFCGGCARLPPSRNALSGKRLRVTLRFAAGIDPFSHYYFLINLPRDANGTITTGDINAPGPVPVLFFPYGNGFATGPVGERFAFTDFVVFDNLQAQGYALYHVIGETDRGQFSLPSAPLTFTTPNPNDARTANQLQFEIDLSQLVVNADGTPFADQTQAITIAQAIRFVQVNIVATDLVPRDATTSVNKRVDSLGETANPPGSLNPGIGASSFLTIDLSQTGTIYDNARAEQLGQNIAEPSSFDLFGGSYPPIDLVDWTIEVRQVQ